VKVFYSDIRIQVQYFCVYLRVISQLYILYILNVRFIVKCGRYVEEIFVDIFKTRESYFRILNSKYGKYWTITS
jgi:hypothetical protein